MKFIELTRDGEVIGLYSCTNPNTSDEQIEEVLKQNSELCDKGFYERGEQILTSVGVERVFIDLAVEL